MKDLFVIVGNRIFFMRDMRDLSIVGNRNFNRCSVYLFVDILYLRDPFIAGDRNNYCCSFYLFAIITVSLPRFSVITNLQFAAAYFPL